MFTLGFFLWNVLRKASLRADRGGPQRRKLECGTTAERCLPGRKRGKGEGIMNENVDSLMIRLVGLALAVLMMAGMTIYTGLFPKASAKAADTHAAVISVQEGLCGSGGRSAERLSGSSFKNKRGAPRSSSLRGAPFLRRRRRRYCAVKHLTVATNRVGKLLLSSKCQRKSWRTVRNSESAEKY